MRKTIFLLSCIIVAATISLSSATSIQYSEADSATSKPYTIQQADRISDDNADWIHYDDGINIMGFRWNVIDHDTFEWGIRLTPEELHNYQGRSISVIRHYHGWVGDTNPFRTKGEIRIYDAKTPTQPGKLLTTEPFSVEIPGWHDVVLSEPIPIEEKDYWVTLHAEDYTYYPAGAGKGPCMRYKGGWVTNDGTHWEQLTDKGYHYNWNLWVGVSPLAIQNVTGGLLLKTTFINHGSEPLSTINWTITTTGGILDIINRSSSGTINSLDQNNQTDITVRIPFGLGPATITIEATTMQKRAYLKKYIPVVLIGPFVLIP